MPVVGEGVDGAPHPAHALGIQTINRFIENHVFGVAKQRGSQTEPLLHA